MKLFSVPIVIHATAYIKAMTPEQAATMAKVNFTGDELILNPGTFGRIEISNACYDSPDMPVISLSPAMTIEGPRGAVEYVEGQE